MIREAVASDVPAIFSMLQESAAGQGFPNELAVTEQDLLEDGFGPSPRYHALIAEHNHTPAGLALYFFNYSTWTSRNGLYLEDLFVRPDFRRLGLAKALIHRLAEIALANDCRRFQWVVHRGNTAAIRLYQSAGAQLLEDWLLMSIKGAALTQAGSSPAKQQPPRPL